MTVTEHWESPSQFYNGKLSTHKETYNALGYATSGAAVAAVSTTAPTSVVLDGFVLAKRTFNSKSLDDGGSEGKYRVDVNFSHVDNPQNEDDQLQNPGDSEEAFDFAGANVNIKRALAQEQYNKTGKTAPNYTSAASGRPVNVVGSDVQGVDVLAPSGTWRETHLIDSATVDDAWLTDRYDLIGKVNDSTFRSFDAEEALFTRISGTRQGTGTWRVSYEFAINKADSVLDPNDTPRARLGWRYAWNLFETGADAANSRIREESLSTLIAQIYDLGDFSILP